MTSPKIAEGWTPNEEHKDLITPIPFDDLGIHSPSELRVVLVHRFFSPVSAGVRAVLNFYKVKQDRTVMDLPLKQAVPWSDYKKVPIVLVLPKNDDVNSEGGYQVNDSHYIVRNLYPALTSGRNFEEDIGGADLEKEVIDLLPLSIIMSFFSTPEGPSQFGRHFSVPEASNPIIKYVAMNRVSSRMTKLNNKYKETLREKMAWFVDKIKERNDDGMFWATKDEPGPIDLYIFGFLCAFIAMAEDKPVNLGNKKEKNWILEDLKEANALEWFNAVDAAYKTNSKEDVIPEEAKDAAASSIYGWW